MATLSASASAQAGTPRRAHNTQLIETALVAILLAVAGYCALFVAPTEATMGVIQRIFYFHVPSWWSAFVAFAIVLASNLAYLRGRNPKWDWLGVSAAEVGVAFVTVGLVTGPIWAHPVWGIWWTWDARLTSAFVLWVLYVSYLLLRNLIEEPERRAVISAVFGIFAAVDIPLVYFSIWFFRTQHPQPVIGDGGSLDPTMGKVLLLCWASMLGILVLLVRQRYRVEALRWDVDRLRLEAAQNANESGAR
jgi:heme exporter protein C